MDAKQLKAAFEKHGIRRVKVGGFDVDGILRGKYVALDKFWSALEDPIGFCDVVFGWDASDVLYDNARITGWHTGYPDARARIDPSTFRVLPWEPNTAFFLLDFHRPDGKPLAVSPRHVLRRVIERAKRMGYTPRAAIEYEYWFFHEDSHSARAKRFCNLTPMTPGMFGYSVLRASVHSDLAHAILDSMRALGVEI